MKLFALLVAVLVSSASAQQLECKIDLAFLVDSSGSIYGDGTGTEQNWVDIKSFLRRLVENFPISPDDTQVAAITFASMATLEWNLDAYDNRNDLVNRINGLQHPNGGTTHMEEALEMVRDQVFASSANRRDAVDIVFLITDGVPNPYNPDLFRRTLSDVQRRVTDMIGVAVGDAVDQDIMRMIDSDYISVTDFRSLGDIVLEVSQRACQIVTTTTPLPGDCPPPMNTYFFSAQAMEDTGMIFDDGAMLGFTEVMTNMGGAYDGISTFTCPCNGYYEFHLTMNGVDFGMAAAIVKEGDVVSPLAYVQYGQSNSMSTSTIIQCYAGEQVWAQVIMTHAKNPLMPCTIEDYSLMGFMGQLITTF